MALAVARSLCAVWAGVSLDEVLISQSKVKMNMFDVSEPRIDVSTFHSIVVVWSVAWWAAQLHDSLIWRLLRMAGW